ncbi:type I-F CRISPR-associated endoribonuclease Cas6/Csy4 [Maribrevibacterium harenarium]|uniref:Type I-F CRISPR-associated endoribonuclease Cas6/Csy4 n=1 Tax=Maribrevibacterium harenarium TaxID=2589817 RepID=A0A501WE37_9GAMM|nr:type I-F CRISPR-associated endoribonuclease Cas6/Csy4 [Maribrevibacterium harenarium]TPE46670.1 type I-F CRISPR-associated endoribonuclease Cas6/Csy4 [Maribrevibacterium harenarium]
MKLFSVKITYLPEKCDHALLAGRCIKVLHAFMSRNGQFNIAVAFPRWSENTIGNQLVFVSPDYKFLEMLLEQPYFRMMIENGLFETGTVVDLPVSDSYVKFVRNQSIDKMTPAAKARRLRRAKKRALARGEVFDPIAPRSKDVDFFHSIPMESSESEMSYLLRVQRYEVQQANTVASFEVCSYGLSTNESHQALIPSSVT